MRTARMPEAEWRQALRKSASMVAKEDESSTGHIWAAGFHHVMVRSCLAHVLKFMNCLLLLYSNFFLTVVNLGY
jgi:hypothetical protein